MQNPCEDLDYLLKEIENLKLKVESMVAQHQQKGSPVSVARPLSPVLTPPKQSESPNTPSGRKALPRRSQITNVCAQTQEIRPGFFTPPSSPQRAKKTNEVHSPYSKIGPN